VILAFDRSRYDEAYLRHGYSEANVQLVVIARLRQLQCWVHVVDAGADKLRRQAAGALRRAGARTAAIVGRTGMDPGIVDIVGIAADGRPLFVEVKRPAWLAPSHLTGKLTQRHAAGELTEDQRAFLLEAERRGAVAGVAWAALDVDAIVAGARRAA
jgi:hypothetical protein